MSNTLTRQSSQSQGSTYSESAELSRRSAQVTRYFSFGLIAIAVAAFCLLLIVLARISALTQDPYFRLLRLFFSNPNLESNALVFLEIPYSQNLIPLLNLAIIAPVVSIVFAPWRGSCFAVMAVRTAFYSIKDNKPISLPNFVPLLGLALISISGSTLTIALELDFSNVRAISPSLISVIYAFHLESLYAVGGNWNDSLWGLTAFHSLAFLVLGIFILRIRNGLRIAVVDAIISGSLILVIFELLIFRSVILGYSTPGLSFMYHSVIIGGFTWFTNFDALASGILVLLAAFGVRTKFCTRSVAF